MTSTTKALSTAGSGADPTGAHPRRPWLMVLPLRAAEQHVLVVIGGADAARARAAAGSWPRAAAASCPDRVVEVARESVADILVRCAPQIGPGQPRTQQHP